MLRFTVVLTVFRALVLLTMSDTLNLQDLYICSTRILSLKNRNFKNILRVRILKPIIGKSLTRHSYPPPLRFLSRMHKHQSLHVDTLQNSAFRRCNVCLAVRSNSKVRTPDVTPDLVHPRQVHPPPLGRPWRPLHNPRLGDSARILVLAKLLRTQPAVFHRRFHA